ncbi:MAG: D-glycero-beta-D-manno-heptose 1-phosphate adenylyltransferase [Candidatus Omnitrophica bacterium]|nr:D-glycero-beta-D-manno-heptose 1-phosphate adenylyltransferase [Candidatus Omnitrophota bacterium]
MRRQGKRIAFTNGCFDLLHVGHLDYLERTKRLADVLVVGVNTDASVRGLKGAGRPVTPEKERARLVASLKPVDFVVLFSESTPRRVIEAIQPDVLTKGGDWKPSQIVGADVVKARGGRVVSIPFTKGRSTTKLLSKLHHL